MADKESDAGETLEAGSIQVMLNSTRIETTIHGDYQASITLVAASSSYRLLELLITRLSGMKIPLRSGLQEDAIEMYQQDLAKANAKIAELNAKLDWIEVTYPGLLSWRNE